MKLKIKTILFLAISLTLLVPCFASKASNQLKATVDEVLSVLKDDNLKGDQNKEARRAKISKLLETRFTYPTMSRGALGRNWRSLNDKQKSEFIPLFADLLKNTYIDKVESYTNEKINYSGERELKKDKKVVVETELVSGDSVIPIYYSLLNKGGNWLVYDIDIEGVKLVKNYRSQFAEIYEKKGFDGLINSLKNKK